MSNELVSPLAEIIRRAAESKADGPIAKIKKRLADASSEVVLLADTSSSMEDLVGHTNMRKCDHQSRPPCLHEGANEIYSD